MHIILQGGPFSSVHYHLEGNLELELLEKKHKEVDNAQVFVLFCF